MLRMVASWCADFNPCTQLCCGSRLPSQGQTSTVKPGNPRHQSDASQQLQLAATEVVAVLASNEAPEPPWLSAAFQDFRDDPGTSDIVAARAAGVAAEQLVLRPWTFPEVTQTLSAKGIWSHMVNHAVLGYNRWVTKLPFHLVNLVEHPGLLVHPANCLESEPDPFLLSPARGNAKCILPYQNFQLAKICAFMCVPACSRTAGWHNKVSSVSSDQN